MTSQRAFAGSAALLFAASATMTIIWCGSMSAMGGMAMPWMRMPGQSWPGAAAGYLGMWIVMMVAMMLPTLLPMLARYRWSVGPAGARRLGWLTLIVATGYFLVWALLGLVTYPLGVVLAGLGLHWPALARATPTAVGVVVLIAGALQFTAWKARRLACCQRVSARGRALRADAATALRHGLRLGLQCSYCCASLTAILLAIGVMDLRAMAGVTAAITLERLAPSSGRAARVVGFVIIAAGSLLVARATLAQ